MPINKLKAFLIIFLISYLAVGIWFLVLENHFVFFHPLAFPLAFVWAFVFYFLGFAKPIINYFDVKHYEQQDEMIFQRDLRREVQRKRALSQVDNENLHYQNQLRIEYIAKVAYIHLQSNQILAQMYQNAIIHNSQNNELEAQSQLIELEQELQRQGLI